MSSGTNFRSAGPLRARASSVFQKSEPQSHRELSETTNRPRGSAVRFKKDILPSQSTIPTVSPTHSHNHADPFSKDGLRKALLSSDWRQRPSDVLPQVKVIELHKPEPQPERLQKMDSSINGEHFHGQDSTSTGQNPASYLNNQETLPQASSKTSRDNSQGNDGNRGDDNGPGRSDDEPGDRISPSLALGPKQLTTLKRLYRPTARGESDGIFAANPHNYHTDAIEFVLGTHNNIGLAIVSEMNLVHSYDSPPNQNSQPMVQMQRVVNLNGLRPMQWNKLDRRSHNEDTVDEAMQDDASRECTESLDKAGKSDTNSIELIHEQQEGEEEKKRFRNMLAKLNTGRAQKVEGSPTNNIDQEHLCTSTRSSSSTENQVLKDSRSSSNSLNPRAPSFFSVPQTRKSSTYHGRSHTINHRPKLHGLFDQPWSDGTTDVLCASPRRRANSLLGDSHVSDSLLSLADKIKRAAKDTQQIEELTGAPPTDAQVQAIMRRLGIESLSGYPELLKSIHATSFESGGQPTRLGQQSRMQSWIQQPGFNLHPPSIPGVPSMGDFQLSSLPRFELNHSQAASFSSPLPVDRPEIISRAAGPIPTLLPPPVMPQSSGINQQRRPTMKEVMEGIENEVRANPFASCPEASSLLGPSFVQLPGLPPTLIGPKPVMKPKGAPRPHDPL
ncbi:hypothetical protein G7054_g3097 [Neopestalotiopsis clavispora]|nr:hypothetical protein G7054_g3097 [Neopestalotiopsis clavispora]